MKYTVLVEYGSNLHKAAKLTLTDENGNIILNETPISIPFIKYGKEKSRTKAPNAPLGVKNVTSIKEDLSPAQFAIIKDNEYIKRYEKLYQDIAKRDELLFIESEDGNIAFAPDNSDTTKAIVSDPDFFMMRKKDFFKLLNATMIGEVNVKVKKSLLINTEDVYINTEHISHTTRDKIIEMSSIKRGLMNFNLSPVIVPYGTEMKFKHNETYKLNPEKRPDLKDVSFFTKVIQFVTKRSIFNNSSEIPVRKNEHDAGNEYKKIVEENKSRYLEAAAKVRETQSNQDVYGDYRGSVSKVDNLNSMAFAAMVPNAHLYIPGSWAAQEKNMRENAKPPTLPNYNLFSSKSVNQGRLNVNEMTDVGNAILGRIKELKADSLLKAKSEIDSVDKNLDEKRKPKP